VETDQAKFVVGEVVITPAASTALASNGQTLADLLGRHQAGNWGDVSPQARELNERALTECFNLESAYLLPSGHRLVVVTNRQRTLTMVHLDGLPG
jgi:hypothetical protein